VARYVFDIEADGLLDTISKIHSIVLKDIDTGDVFSASSGNGRIGEALEMLGYADLLIGHNIIKYDLPAIKQIFPGWETKAQVRDTIVWTRLIWPSDALLEIDTKNRKFPGRLVGRHSLEAWGHRVGEYKGAFAGPWDKWTPEMQTYCEQDIEVTAKLYAMLVKQGYSETAIQLEHDVQEIIFRQEQTGVPFDEKKAAALYASLVQTRLEAEKELAGLFAPWYQPGKLFTPKRDNKKLGYVSGCEMQHVKLVEFNPGSRDHIADRLIKLRGWKPKAFTADGGAQVDEKILSSLPYPEAKKLTRYLLIQKRIGQLAEGKKALLKFVKNGRIHGEVITNGTVTGRAAHANPNLGQVPKVKKGKDGVVLHGEQGLWGYEFRDLFYAPEGWCMVGVDASGLELRMLGSRLARWDGGAYAAEVVGGDVHALHAAALGIERDPSKTWTYAWLYGAGDKKLGTILKAKNPVSAGKQSRAVFLHKIPALGHLIAAVKHRHNARQYIIGLDGRHVQTRSEHSALNSLLQCDGSLVVKFWMVKLDRAIKERGWQHGKDFAQVLYVHDELQFLARPAIAKELGVIAVQILREVGVSLGLRVPLDGEYKQGRTWAETH
jgi:DNA polymerase-1